MAEAWAVPDYYTAGAQDPGRGQHYPLVPPKRCPSPPPLLSYSDPVTRPKRAEVLNSATRDGLPPITPPFLAGSISWHVRYRTVERCANFGLTESFVPKASHQRIHNMVEGYQIVGIALV